MEWAKWDFQALTECVQQTTLEEGSGQNIGFEHRQAWRMMRERTLLVPWEECEPLRIMYRYCTACSSFTFWEYFTDGSGMTFGICWECEYFVRRWKKVYIDKMLYNPIHAPERIVYDTSEYHRLSGDEVIDVGYKPPTIEELREKRSEGLIFPEETRTAGSGGPTGITVHLPQSLLKGRNDARSD